MDDCHAKKKILLDITPAVAKYAAIHGALYDKEIGWYCFEPVPIELEDFVVPTARLKNQPNPQNIQCPICGAQMQLKPTQKGGIFWSCMSFPTCKGYRHVEDAEDSSFKKVHTELRKKVNVKSSFTELAKVGLREFRHQNEFYNWLKKPKIALGGKTPLQIIDTEKGYKKVVELLRKINR